MSSSKQGLSPATQLAPRLIHLQPTKGFGFCCSVLSSPGEVSRIALSSLLMCPKENLKIQLASEEIGHVLCTFLKGP